jgi:hypothetical protein
MNTKATSTVQFYLDFAKDKIMAVEVRRIILEQHEFQAVLNVYANLEDNDFPNGFVVGFEIEKEAPLEISVSLQLPNGEQLRIEIDETTIVEAIINFCIQTKIPVSRKSKKTANLNNGKISCDMSLVNPSFTANL